MAELLDRIDEADARGRELEDKLSGATGGDGSEYARLAKELGGLRALREVGGRYREALEGLEDARAMLDDADPDVQEMARAEIAELEASLPGLEAELKDLLIPKDPNDEKNVIIEVRAGTGGDEAALFAGDLFRMYARYAEQQGWKYEALSMSETDGGGMKEVIALISGDRVYSRLKWESGVHRVQRVPTTESQGRIHTSTATVAVLPEAEEVDLQIAANDLRIDVFRASGPGGQSVNTTDSAVRITHVPTGVVVICQDEKSQHKNKAQAMKILRSRILEAEKQRQADERASERRSQVGTGGRSERIRTYNFPQSRVSDHRIGLTLHKLEAILEGSLDELLDGVGTGLASVGPEGAA
jgi:peptide chain release factor 1